MHACTQWRWDQVQNLVRWCRALSLRVAQGQTLSIKVGTNYLRQPKTTSASAHQLRIQASAGAASVTHEQRGVGRVVSTNNAVLGGGFVHIVSEVSRMHL
jgi:hypothetical protein